MTEALRFLLLLELVGLLAAPLSALALARLPGGGLGFAKPLGFVVGGWVIWLVGSGWRAGTAATLVAAGVLAVASLVAWRSGRGRAADPLRRSLALAAEAVFLVAFAAMVVLVAFSPDVWGTEKPMDVAFLTAVQAASSFPPADPWLAGETLNYYYLGHVAMGTLAGLAGAEPSRGYNLAVAALFALSATAAFAVGAALWAGLRGSTRARGPIGGGLLAVALCLVLGNLAAARELFETTGPLTAYDWFAPSRVVPGTINEFPAFAFTLGDLHAHVLAIPATLIVVALAVQVVSAGPPGRGAGVVAAIVLGSLYATNAWSYPVAAGILVLAAILRRGAAAWTALVLAGSVVAVLPFLLDYEPAASGIGLVGDRGSPGAALVDLGLLYGLFAWLAIGALLLRRRLAGPQRVVWMLAGAGALCVAVPELLYVRDEFDGSSLYRMNTVFKLGFQAWLLLALAATGILALALRRPLGRVRGAWLAGAAVLIALATVYPVAGTVARKDGFAGPATLDGLRWLRAGAPGDPGALAWLRDHAAGDAVVLEAVGEDYSPAGHGRVSAFTGRPTVLGWPGHELQWGHPPGRRADDVAALYGADTPAAARPLLERYGVRYVVVGPLERAAHGAAGAAVWDQLGERVYDRAGTTVWELQDTPRRT